ncbi:MAG: pitrilysin family protein [Gemmatimonadota bacterium]
MRGARGPGALFGRAIIGASVAAILGGAAMVAPSYAQDLPVTRLTLDNGMRFLVLPRPGAPTVSFVVRFDVGSANERPGETGVAHLLEHLLFKGSSSVGTTNWAVERRYLDRIDAAADSLEAARGGTPPEAGADTAEAARLLARVAALEDTARAFVAPNEWVQLLVEQGARGLNATTDVDATTYFVELPSNRIELWFALEADRMSDPVFREFYTERDVVAEERRLRVEDQSGGRLEQALLAAAYRVHPYGVPVIGHARDLGALTRARVRAYHERYYGPNNAIVAVVGDVDEDAVAAYAERYFGRIPRRDEPPPVGRAEPPQAAPRRAHVSFDAEPQVRLAWHTVTAGHPDAAALSVLASVLAGGTTSRLYKRLVLEDRSALAVFAGGGPGAKFPGLMTISAAPLAPHDNAALEAAILEEVARLAAAPPSERELAAVRNQVEVGEVERLSSNLGLAFQLAASETLFDDWRATFRATAELRAVTAEDVSRVAAAYLRAAAVTVATLSREEEP